jgi:hypothetical protein
VLCVPIGRLAENVIYQLILALMGVSSYLFGSFSSEKEHAFFLRRHVVQPQ